MLVRKSNLLPPEAILLYMHPLCNLSGKPVQLLPTVNLTSQSRGSNLCRHRQNDLRFKLSVSDFKHNMVVGVRCGGLRFSGVDLLNFLSSSLFFKSIIVFIDVDIDSLCSLFIQVLILSQRFPLTYVVNALLSTSEVK